MIISFKHLFGILSLNERRSFFKLLMFICLVALIDSFGVFSVMPFLALLSNPQIIKENYYASLIYSYLEFDNINQFMVWAGFLMFSLILSSLVLKSVAAYFQFKFSYRQEHKISSKLFHNYLLNDYEWHVENHSAELSKQILSEVSVVTHQGIMPAVMLIAQAANSILIILVLMLVDFFSTLAIALSAGLIYFLITAIFSAYLKKNAIERLNYNESRFRLINEALPAIRELKIYNVENYFLTEFSRAARGLSNNLIKGQIIGQMPRFFLEGLAFGGIIISVIILMLNGHSINEFLPIVSLYIFAGYKLMPAAQQIYNSITQIKFVAPSLQKIHFEYQKSGWKENDYRVSEKKQTWNKIPPSIRIENLCFSYSGKARAALEGLTFIIEGGSAYAIIGPSGSGKSTLVALLTGLLKPKAGSISFCFENNAAKFEQVNCLHGVGYVPQEIHLIDTTITSNIAFGEAREKIDHGRVVKAAKMAGIHDFIIGSLENKYETVVGDAGSRLSGGQRQRIGIARALYREPALLIFDEATSALDIRTENDILKTILSLKNEVTVIVVAHRVATIEKIDNIIMIEEGKLVAKGSFKELTCTNEKVNKFLYGER